MSTSGTKTRVHPLDNQAGGILLAALAILLVAGSVSAGVAHLVSSSSEGSVNSLNSEQAIFSAESARYLLSQEDTSCGDLTNPQQIGDESFYFTCNPDPDYCANEEQVGLLAWVGSTDPANSRSTHRICIIPPSDSSCEPPPSSWSEAEEGACYAPESGNQVTVSGNDRPGTAVTIQGNLTINGAAADDFDSPICILGDININGDPDGAFPGGGFYLGSLSASGPPNATINIDHCDQDPCSDGGCTLNSSANCKALGEQLAEFDCPSLNSSNPNSGWEYSR